MCSDSLVGIVTLFSDYWTILKNRKTTVNLNWNHIAVSAGIEMLAQNFYRSKTVLKKANGELV